MLDGLNITEILVAFFSGGSAVALIKALPVLLSIRKSRSEVALTDIAWIYEVMTRAKALLQASDVWIGRSSNGGGIPRVGHSVFHTFQYNVSDGLDFPQADKSIPVDSGLASFLARSAASRVTIQNTHLFTGEMHKILESRGIVNVVGFHILTTDKNFFYLGFGFKTYTLMQVEKQAKVIALAESIKKKMIAARS